MSVMKESTLQFATPDDFLIHGVLNQWQPANRLLIFVHGLTGEKEFHLYYDAARYFPQRGIDVFRFDLFSNEHKGRTLSDATISSFAADLDSVLAHFSGDYDEIHVVGHSIGGCIAMNARQAPITSLVLWDTGLYRPSAFEEKVQYHPELDKYVAHLKIEYFLSAAFIEERAMQDERVVSKVSCPTKLIFAGNTSLQQTWESRLRFLTVHHDITTIEGAGHGFNEYGVDTPLFEATLDWLQTGYQSHPPASTNSQSD